MKNKLPGRITKLAKIFYMIIMPGITIIGLLFVSQVIPRQRFLGSGIVDIAARILLCLWFCAGYIRMPSLPEKYRIYPNIIWTKSDITPRAKFVYMGLGIIFGIGISIITWWAIGIFLPIFDNYRIFLAAVNGIIFAIPLMAQYEVFKL